jgi:type II secretory pathway component PulL
MRIHDDDDDDVIHVWFAAHSVDTLGGRCAWLEEGNTARACICVDVVDSCLLPKEKSDGHVALVNICSATAA